MDAPAWITQEEAHTGLLRLPSAVLTLISIVRKMQSSLSLVDREVELHFQQSRVLTVVPESGPTENLDEYVGVLLSRSYGFYRNLASLKKIPNKVETYIDMLTSGGAQRILDQSVPLSPDCPQGLLYLPHTSRAQ